MPRSFTLAHSEVNLQTLHPPDPDIHWLKLLIGGAILGSLGWAFNAAWTYSVLSSRLQGLPNWRVLQAIFPYWSIVQAAVVWVADWLLTTSSPTDDPALHRSGLDRRHRIRALTIRFIQSAMFVFISLRTWGMLGDRRTLAANNTLALLVVAADFLTTLLVWSHLRTIVIQVRLRGMWWRLTIMLMLAAASDLLLRLGPLFLAQISSEWQLSSEQYNVRYGIIVAISLLAVLTMGRLAWLLDRDARRAAPPPLN